MLISTVRYLLMGWVDDQLVSPKLHFSYYGFDWVAPLPGMGMYLVFSVMILACLAIVLGFYYRIFSILFFLTFTYVELIDITYYLNHYYFVSIVAYLMIIVPANSFFSIDCLRNPSIKRQLVPRWTIDIFKFQIAVVYIYAGIAKINYDWLFNALPLAIWLPAKSDIPIIGSLFQYKFTAYLFSWLGMLFDTFIVVGLLFKSTRWLSYTAVIIFHTLTGILFQIGVFPVVMIFAVTIFFSSTFHERLLVNIARFLKMRFSLPFIDTSTVKARLVPNRIMLFLLIFISFQLLFPWRYLVYPGNVFWTEEGYRFSWRVMLMEKAGTATFYVRDGDSGREGSVINHQFLNEHQEKQMSMQPDLILQFAHYLEEHYKAEGMSNPKVRVEAWVTLNARPAQLIIDPRLDLTQIDDSWTHKDWINDLNYP